MCIGEEMQLGVGMQERSSGVQERSQRLSLIGCGGPGCWGTRVLGPPYLEAGYAGVAGQPNDGRECRNGLSRNASCSPINGGPLS